MRRRLAAPSLAIALFVLWLLLMQSLAAGTILLGLGLALFWASVAARFDTGGRLPRRPVVMAKLFLRVVADMLRSNAEVIWTVLTRPARRFRSDFVHIPLELTDANGLAILAAIVTFTPGTAWGELSVDKRTLLLHVFAVDDEARVIAAIKQRYERPLREIFE